MKRSPTDFHHFLAAAMLTSLQVIEECIDLYENNDEAEAGANVAGPSHQGSR